MDQSKLYGDVVNKLDGIGEVVVPTAKPKKRILHEQAGIFLNYRHDQECDITKKINHVLQKTRKYKTAPPTVGLDARIREAGLCPHTLESLAIRQAVTEHGVEKAGPKTAEEIQAAMDLLKAELEGLTSSEEVGEVEEVEEVVKVSAAPVKKVAKKKATKKKATKKSPATTEPDL